MSDLDAAVRGLAETLHTGSTPGKPAAPYVPRLITGTVTAVATATCTVAFPSAGGTTDIAGIPFLVTGRAPVVGDVVLVLQMPHQRIVLGALSGSASYSGAGGTGPTTGLSPVRLSAVSLGGAVGTSYAWTTLTVGVNAEVWRMQVTATGGTDWDLLITSQPAGAGEVMFQADHISVPTYSCSWPWRYANGDTPAGSNFYIGVRSHAGTPAITLDDLRADKWT